MNFSVAKDLTFEQAVEIMFGKLKTHKIMALATSVNDKVMVRNMSCVFYDNLVWFKTDKNFRKTQQLYANPNVALCWSGVQIEGVAVNHGLVIDEPERKFEKLYEKYHDGSYNKYSHEETEILFSVEPKFVEVWDTSQENYAYQIFIDFDNKSIEVKAYDQEGK
ncbi:MAG: pyridoxamine 5'-phosphate oxidase family protein [Firmicutes bacterium]|nr:pyridoxamine 5'-phosphate oxidase family protein [Bacillota bacterium]